MAKVPEYVCIYTYTSHYKRNFISFITKFSENIIFVYMNVPLEFDICNVDTFFLKN